MGSATAVLIDGINSAGELAAPHIQSEARKLKLTLKTDACLRPGSVPRQAPGRPRSMGRGTCPENSRGVRKISDRRAPSSCEQKACSPRPWRPPGSPSPAASRRARSSPPRAYGHSCSTSVAAFGKTRLPSPPFPARPGQPPAPGLPSGPAPCTNEALPRIWGAGAAPSPSTFSPISEAFSGKWGKPGTRPVPQSPAHTLFCDPPRPGTPYNF